jgi:hypothetical protein
MKFKKRSRPTVLLMRPTMRVPCPPPPRAVPVTFPPSQLPLREDINDVTAADPPPPVDIKDALDLPGILAAVFKMERPALATPKLDPAS